MPSFPDLIARALARASGLPVEPGPPPRRRPAALPPLRELAAQVAQASDQLGLVVTSRPIDSGTQPHRLMPPAVVLRQRQGAVEAIAVASDVDGAIVATLLQADGGSTPLDRVPDYLEGGAEAWVVSAIAPRESLAEWGPTEHGAPLDRLWRLLGQERQLVTSVYVYAALAGLFGLTLPLGVQAIIGLVSGGLILQPVVLLIAFVVVGTLANGTLQVMQLSVVETIQQRIFARLAFTLTDRLERLHHDRVRGVNLPELMNRFFEVKTIQKSLGKLLTDWVAAGLQVFFGLLLLTFYHPWFAIFGILQVAILLAVFRWTAPLGWQTSLGESKHKYLVAHWLEELARGARTLRFAGRSTMAADRTEREVAAYVGFRAAHFKVLARQSMAFVAFKTLITAGLLILGSVLVVRRQITLGQFVASEIVIVTVLLAIEKLIFGLADIYDILTALEKAGHAAHLPLSTRAHAQVVPTSDPPGMSVALRGVTYRYATGDQFVLRDLSFAIGAGEHVALTGPHGAGVSTTLAAVAGLLEDWTGAVQLDGRPLRDLDRALVAEQIAWGGIDGDVIDGTIEENVSLGRPGVRTEQVLEALARVGLAEWVARQPDGVLTPAPIDGQPWPRHIVARLQLARMVAGRPRLIVADRILDLLDPAERVELLPILFDRSAGWSCLIASHHADLLRQADRVVRLERGQVAHDAAPAAVFAADPWCRQLEGTRWAR